MNKVKYYQIVTEDRTASIIIYGDITSWPWLESDVSAFNIIKEIDELDVDQINVYINSYGGEVAEAIAIYSALQRHKATITTYCDGFACSAASIIFCAGTKRVINKIAMLMIHNAWSYACGNADEMRKAADDIEKISKCSIEAYKSVCNIDENKIKELMDNETWLTADEALEYGFATEIAERKANNDVASQSVVEVIRQALISKAPKGNNNEALFESIENCIENKFNELVAGFVKQPEQNLDQQQKINDYFKNFFANMAKD